MFKSKRRPIVTPQSEHLKLVGTLALLWGNADFDSPPIDRLSLVTGIGFHDRGYGYLDNSPIGEMTDEEWEPIAQRTFHTQYSDLTADMIAKYHFRRLASHGETDVRKAMTAEFSREIEKQLTAHKLSKELFDRIDRITDLCDTISFDFCFEQAASKEFPVFPRNDSKDEVSIRYHVEDGNIHATPWPFSVDSYKGYIIAYKMEGYPEKLDPVILPFHLQN